MVGPMGKILALSGFAETGKDEFFKIAKVVLADKKIRRLSFADSLKNYLDPFLKEETGISAFTTDKEEKTIIRPYLVSIANYYRWKTKGRFWIDKWKEDKQRNFRDYDILFVCDMRFINEVVFIKNEMRGTNISIDLMVDGEAKKPANVSEATQTTMAKSMCDLKFVWEKTDDQRLKTAKVKEFFDAHSSKLL